MSVYLTRSLARAYQDQLLAEAEQLRTHKASRPSGIPLHERFLLQVGDWLISAGVRLREHYEPALCAGLEACQAATGKASAWAPAPSGFQRTAQNGDRSLGQHSASCRDPRAIGPVTAL